MFFLSKFLEATFITGATFILDSSGQKSWKNLCWFFGIFEDTYRTFGSYLTNHINLFAALIQKRLEEVEEEIPFYFLKLITVVTPIPSSLRLCGHVSLPWDGMPK